MKPLVIDIYHGDVVNDFARAKAYGIVGVIHKASQGQSLGGVDRAYATRRKLAAAAGLLWGAYHFMDLSDPEGQAQHFLSVADPDDRTLIALDWENVGGSSPTAEQARVFLERVAEATGRRPVIYSGNVAKERIAGKDEFFGAHRLWLAQYGGSWKVQESWERPWLWQNNGDNSGPGPHRIPGVEGLCDNNTIVDGAAPDDLVALWAA
ncbi:MAG: glycoside hydrolase family 25 protein [Xanthobacteraceae bacterium]